MPPAPGPRPRNAYADENGDTGYDFAAGSSPLFILTALLPLDPESLINQVIVARRRLAKPETFEFHFQHAGPMTRQAFFDAIALERMNLWVAVIHKAFAPLELRQKGKVGLYVHGFAGLTLRSPMALNQVKLHLDGTGSQKAFVQALKNGVRSRCQEAGQRERSFKEIRILDSTHPLIQCADMLTGAAAERAKRGYSVWWPRLRLENLVWWEEGFRRSERNPPD